MARLKGLASFVVLTIALLLGLRVVHVGVPLFFPDTQPGPFHLTSLDEARRRAGFPPLVPAYRPVTLGDRPASLTVARSPRPTFAIVWQGERRLALTQRRGGPMPDHPPTSRPLPDVPDSTWWVEGGRQHLVLRRGEFWLEVETDLPSRDLRRIADTLEPYRGAPGRH